MTAFEDLSLLRAFVCIVECGNISAGARRLKVSQPTLSRQLHALEEQCGAVLLRRDTHAMSVTPTGQRLLADARAMIAHAEEAHQRLREDQMEQSGHLRLFGTIDLGQSIVTRMISSFLQIHPRVTVELALTNRPLHMLREGCDIGILPGKITDESVIARPAGTVVLHLAAAPSLVKKHPVAKELADLKSWPWLSLDGFQYWSAKEITLFARNRAEQTLRISPILLSEGVTSIREATRAGLGVAVLPDWLIDEDLQSGRLVRILPKWKAKDVPIHVVYAGQRLLPARVSAFIDFAVAYLTKDLAPYTPASQRATKTQSF
jgi:DNA-binding transcriptional LysR family regulator